MAENFGIRVSLEKGIAVVRIDRPRKRNALSLRMWIRLREVFEELAANDDARVAIVSGSGGHFCAGADISEFDSNRRDATTGRAYEQEADSAIVAIRDWPGPTLAAISGYAVGGGCSVALACDVRVGDITAKMGIPAARLGILYGTLDCSLLYRQVGLSNAKRVLYSGKQFDAHEAAQLGMLDIIVEENALSAAQEIAQEFAYNAPLTLKGTKFILEACAAGRTDGLAAEINTLIDAAMMSADYAEGRRAFIEKRNPVFVGR
jgi:enoyl-CoA hydratase/carnithine racemase